MLTSSSSDEEDLEGQGQTLMTLHEEIQLRIFDLCDPRSLRNLAMVNRRFNSLVKTNFNFGSSGLNDLPSELVFAILGFLGRSDLGKMAQVSKRFREVVYADGLWSAGAREAVVTNGIDRTFAARTAVNPLSARDKVRVEQNWRNADYIESHLLLQNTRYMPRIQLEHDHLWVSWGNWIWAHPRQTDGTISRTTSRVLKGHKDDVSRFKVKDGIIASGGRDRSMFAWRADTGEYLFSKRYCHGSEISAVDLVPASKVVLTGSRDRTVKLWSYRHNHGRSNRHNTPAPALCAEFDLMDRIWSLAASPAGQKFVVGSAGLGGVPALHLVDLADPNLTLNPMGAGLKRGAGILDIHWTSEQTFLTCGYDTSVRMWDPRTPGNGGCVKAWVEPFDEAIYCLATDNHNTVVAGTARHGMVRLWDMRATNSVQMYYVKNHHCGQSSPVYSIDLDQSHLYVALDQCLSLLSFSGLRNCKRNGNRAQHQGGRNYQNIFRAIR